MFAKSLYSSLKLSHHRFGTIMNLLLMCILTRHGERNGSRDRRFIQKEFHQTE